MKDNNTNQSTKKKKLTVWLAAAICLLVAAAIAVGVVFAVMPAKENIGGEVIDSGNQENPPEGSGGQPNEPDEPKEPEDDPPQADVSSQYEFISPIRDVSVITAHTFWHNKTLNKYHLHQAVDFAAPAGTEVLAAVDGTVLSIEKEDKLYYATVTVEHANGIKTVYKFVEPAEGLAAGSKVNRGDVIATVAAASGIESADGDHLHFEVYKDGVITDPEEYLDLEIK